MCSSWAPHRAFRFCRKSSNLGVAIAALRRAKGQQPSEQKPRFLLAGYEVMSAESAAGDFQPNG
jgi:hypothetical protein